MNKERITKRLIKKAIEGTYGEINAIAKKAGCATKTVMRKLRQYPELNEYLEEEKAVLRVTQKEMATNTILEALTKRADETDKDKERRVKVAMWVAERLGAEDGYNPSIKIETEQPKEQTLNVFVNDLEPDDDTDKAQP